MRLLEGQVIYLHDLIGAVGHSRLAKTYSVSLAIRVMG